MNLPSFFLAISLFFNVLSIPYTGPMVSNWINNLHPVQSHSSNIRLEYNQ